MRYQSIKSHLRPYLIRGRRTTTINHAFAAAVAPNDDFVDARVRDAMAVLGQNPDTDLECVYCGEAAETWDHIFSTVQNSRFSGHGHRLGNLVPCCKPCNSRKGNKRWYVYFAERNAEFDGKESRYARLSDYIKRFSVLDVLPPVSPLHDELEAVRQQVLTLLDQADRLAAQIRASERVSMALAPGCHQTT